MQLSAPSTSADPLLATLAATGPAAPAAGEPTGEFALLFPTLASGQPGATTGPVPAVSKLPACFPGAVSEPVQICGLPTLVTASLGSTAEMNVTAQRPDIRGGTSAVTAAMDAPGGEGGSEEVTGFSGGRKPTAKSGGSRTEGRTTSDSRPTRSQPGPGSKDPVAIVDPALWAALVPALPVPESVDPTLGEVGGISASPAETGVVAVGDPLASGVGGEEQTVDAPQGWRSPVFTLNGSDTLNLASARLAAGAPLRRDDWENRGIEPALQNTPELAPGMLPMGDAGIRAVDAWPQASVAAPLLSTVGPRDPQVIPPLAFAPSVRGPRPVVDGTESSRQSAPPPPQAGEAWINGGRDAAPVPSTFPFPSSAPLDGAAISGAPVPASALGAPVAVVVSANAAEPYSRPLTSSQTPRPEGDPAGSPRAGAFSGREQVYPPQAALQATGARGPAADSMDPAAENPPAADPGRQLGGRRRDASGRTLARASFSAAENIAGRGGNSSDVQAAGIESSLKYFQAPTVKEVADVVRRVGTDTANHPASMFAFPFSFRNDSVAVTPTSLEFAPVEAAVAEVTSTDLQSPVDPASVTARRAVDAVLSAAERLGQGERSAVNLQFPMGDTELSVRVELRDAEVRTTFHTDSAELRAALARECQALSLESPDRGYRLAAPLISGGGANDSTAFSAFAGDASADRREARQRHAGDDEGGFLPAALRPAGARSGDAAGAAPVRSSGISTSLHLHTLA